MATKHKLSKFRVNYSIMVNGEEFPRENDFDATDNKDARLQLEELMDKVTPPVEYHVHLISML